MARARNIKPGFFVNDDLSDCDPLARILFIGLWTLADCEGRLKDRPRQIKAQILPYDNCDADDLLINLEQSGFIQRYLVQGQPVMQVLNFLKHQNPHKNEREKGSSLKGYGDRDKEPDKKQQDEGESRENQINPDKDGTSHADPLLLNPDSLDPLTESPSTEGGLPVTTMPSKLDDVKRILDHLITVSGKGFKHVESNYTPIKARMKEGHSVTDILAVIDMKDRDWPVGDPFRQYLRPETLFGAKKFNGYVGELGVETPEQERNRKLEEWASSTTPQGDVIEGEVMQ